MLPLQHGIVTNWDDMEPDIDFHEKIDVLHGQTLMVGMNQKDSYEGDEAQCEAGVPNLAKMEATEATLHYKEVASLRDDHFARRPTLEATESNLHEKIDASHSTQPATLPIMVGMYQKDIGVEDKAQSKRGVPSQVKMEATVAVFRENIDTSQSMLVEHFGALSSSFDMLESKFQEEIASLRDSHSAKHFGMEAADSNLHEKIDAWHGLHCGTMAIMVGMNQQESYVSDKGQSERCVTLLANMEAIEATVRQEEIASLRDDDSTKHSMMEAIESNLHEKTGASHNAQFATLTIMGDTDQKDTGVKDEAQSKCGVPHLAKVEATEAVLYERIDTFQSMHTEHSGALTLTLDMLEYRLQEEIVDFGDDLSAKYFGLEATESKLHEKIDASQGAHSCTLATSFAVGMNQKDSYIGNEAQSKRGVPPRPPHPPPPPPMVDWKYTYTFREMLKTWPGHVEYPSDMENITDAQYTWVRSHWPIGVPMFELS